jgi:hypothetical protein
MRKNEHPAYGKTHIMIRGCSHRGRMVTVQQTHTVAPRLIELHGRVITSVTVLLGRAIKPFLRLLRRFVLTGLGSEAIIRRKFSLRLYGRRFLKTGYDKIS